MVSHDIILHIISYPSSEYHIIIIYYHILSIIIIYQNHYHIISHHIHPHYIISRHIIPFPWALYHITSLLSSYQNPVQRINWVPNYIHQLHPPISIPLSKYLNRIGVTKGWTMLNIFKKFCKNINISFMCKHFFNWTKIKFVFILNISVVFIFSFTIIYNLFFVFHLSFFFFQ